MSNEVDKVDEEAPIWIGEESNFQDSDKVEQDDVEQDFEANVATDDKGDSADKRSKDDDFSRDQDIDVENPDGETPVVTTILEAKTIESTETEIENRLEEELAKNNDKIESGVVPERYGDHMMPSLLQNESPVLIENARASEHTTQKDTVVLDRPIEDAEELITFYTAPKRFAKRPIVKSDITGTSARNKYPQDAYSFIALNGSGNGKPWTRQRVVYFLFGLLPFVFQMVLLVLLAYSQTNELRGTIGENDNPDQGKQGIMGLFARFIPANSTPIVRWAQVVSLAAYVIFPSSSLQDIVRAVQLFPYYTKEVPNPSFWLRLSCILRATQGVTAMIVTLLLVLTSVTVVDIILNFTAVNFISGLDEDAFFLAMTGDFSPGLKSEAETISETDLPPCMFKKDESRWKCYKWITGLVYLFLFGVVAFIFAAQNSKSVWATKLLRVQFQDTTGLNEYSGCFEMTTTSSSVKYSRRTYHSFDTGSLNTSIGYCREDRQWILFKGNTTDPCDAPDEEGILLARSSKTDTFDISSMFEESWVSASNTPLDLYFFDADGNETTIEENCGLTLGDGVCNPAFNALGYDFDGGDCCAATCTKSNCGRGGLTSVFGNSTVSGDGYENCVDPSMVPITIYLNNVTSSRDPEFTGWKQLSDVPLVVQQEWDFEENIFIEWMNAEPVKTYLSLDCNGKNVMTAYIDNTMINQSQTVMVEDGASCSLVVRNTTSNLAIWYIDYTVYHDDAIDGDSATQRVEILSGHSAEAETVSFTRIPECYFEKLHNHVDIESIYTGNSSFNQVIDWLLKDPDPKQQCEDSNFIERYALLNANYAFNPTIPFIARDEQCRWNSIACIEGKVVSIELSEQGLEEDITIPTELKLISNLTTFRLDINQLKSLPAEIGDLRSLQKLYLKRNELWSLPIEIGNLKSLQTLDMNENELQSLPTEIGNLSTLQELALGNNELASLPTEIGKLSSLQELYFYDNQLTSLPAEIGNLSTLQELALGSNELASLPTEIGNLSSLQILDLGSNQLTSLPTEIGNLSSLQELNLWNNDLTSLPTEIGNLSSLQLLDLEDDYELESLPTEIGNLSSLQYLLLYDNLLKSFPSQIGNLSSLQELSVYYNLLASLPTEIGKLSSLLELALGLNSIKFLPTEIGNLSTLQILDLGDNELTSLPTEIGKLSSLQELYFYDNQLTSLTTEIGYLSSLQKLEWAGNQLASLPTEIGALTILQTLHSSYNKLTSLPTEIGNLSSLQLLDLDDNQLTSLPAEIANLSSLEYLRLGNNELTSLPTEIGKLSSLQELYFSGNQLTSLPTEIGNLSNLFVLKYDANVQLPEEIISLCASINCSPEPISATASPSETDTAWQAEIGSLTILEYLYLLSNELTSLPTDTGNLTNFEELDLRDKQLESLPTEIGDLSSLQKLNLGSNKLLSLPTEIGNLSSLEELYLYENQLTSLPAKIGNLSGLQNIDLAGNQLESLPTEIGNLASLQTLTLWSNPLTSLPTEIGDLSSLQKLDLGSNQLTSLPTEIGNLPNLQYLYLDENQLTSLPTEIGNLSSLQELWLSDNSFASLPSEIGNLFNLTYLKYDANVQLPEEIISLCSTIFCYSEAVETSFPTLFTSTVSPSEL